VADSIKIALLADTRSASRGLDTFSSDTTKAAAAAKKAAANIDASFEKVADSSDNIASKGSQAAGALSGLGGVAESAGGPFAALGGAMIAAGGASQALADAGDLLNVVTETQIGKNIALKAQTIGTTIAQKGAAAASKAWAVAQLALNAVMSANPIALVVIAIAALVAAFVIAYKKSDTFRRIVDKAFAVVKNAAAAVATFFTTKVPAAFDKVIGAAQSALGWVKKNWPTILAVLTGPFGLAVLAIAKNWDKIKAGAGKVVDFVKDKFNGVVDFFRGMPSRIASAVSGLWNGLSSGFRGVINDIIGWWNNLSFSLDIPDVIPGLPDSFSISTPNIPYLAAGGIVTRPTLAVIGEAGPEAVIPLNGRYDTGMDSSAIVGELQALRTALTDLSRKLSHFERQKDPRAIRQAEVMGQNFGREINRAATNGRRRSIRGGNVV
jgi:phage-related protein